MGGGGAGGKVKRYILGCEGVRSVGELYLTGDTVRASKRELNIYFGEGECE